MLVSSSKIGLLLLLLLAVIGCSSLPEVALDEQSRDRWSQYQLEAGRFNHWDLHGRAAIFVNDEVHNVGLKWNRNPETFEMILEAPFGQGMFRLQSNRKLVNLTLPDGQVVYGEDAEEALIKVIGWSIPVSGLEFWIRGIPQKDGDANYDLNGDGRLKSLLQNGWRINYLDYFEPQGPAKGLPRKMYLKRNDLAIKIVIEHWQKPKTIEIDSGLFPEFN